MRYHTETLPKGTRAVLDQIKQVPDIQNFYLSGGSALALQLGHRESEDLDFFTKVIFQPEALQRKLSAYGPLDDVTIAENTLNLFMRGVKLQFLYYPYDVLKEPIKWGGIYLSSIDDIACTKLLTISMRGSKKDFVDLYIVLRGVTLEDLFTKLDSKYRGLNYNVPHILKSLVYFTDADPQPMPRMHVPVAWEEVKDFIAKQVKSFKL